MEPTTSEETLQILHNIKDHYERHHHVSYTDEALAACVKLSDRYISDRQQPDKAIDAMDEVGSRVHLNNVQIPPEIAQLEQELKEVTEKKQLAVKNQNFELAAGYRDRQTVMEGQLAELNRKWQEGDIDDRQTVTEKEVQDVVSMMTGVPVQRMAQEEGIRLKGMAKELQKHVIAQDKAIEKMVHAIQRNRVGLKDPNHPIGVFMFLGPTGPRNWLSSCLARAKLSSE